MPDYKEGKIYKITYNITGLTYYGSTTQPISQRTGQHRNDFKNNRGDCNSKLVLAGGNYDYCLVEKCPCDDKSELHKRERFYIESNECINLIIPGRTTKEYRAAHKEETAEYGKVYRSENKETIAKRKKVYCSENKEKLSEK